MVGCTFSSHRLDKTQKCIRVEDATLVFDGRIYSTTPRIPVAEFVAKKMQQVDSIKASEAFLCEVEGDFSFMIAEYQRIIAARDPVGVQPLYYGESKKLAVLASNRKAMWKIGIEKTQSFPPGHLALVSQKGYKFKSVKTLAYPNPKPVILQEAAKTLQSLLAMI